MLCGGRRDDRDRNNQVVNVVVLWRYSGIQFEGGILDHLCRRRRQQVNPRKRRQLLGGMDVNGDKMLAEGHALPADIAGRVIQDAGILLLGDPKGVVGTLKDGLVLVVHVLHALQGVTKCLFMVGPGGGELVHVALQSLMLLLALLGQLVDLFLVARDLGVGRFDRGIILLDVLNMDDVGVKNSGDLLVRSVGGVVVKHEALQLAQVILDLTGVVAHRTVGGKGGEKGVGKVVLMLGDGDPDGG